MVELIIKHILNFGWFALMLFSLYGCSGCTAQHDPRPDWKKFDKEMTIAHRKLPKLTASGELPSGEGEKKVTVAELYSQYCASCHGANGEGDGPAGVALSPKPRSFTDAAWQNSVDDEHLLKVIKSGGVAVGLSPLMAPWGAVLDDGQLAEMVDYVRAFKG